MKGTPSAFSEK
jgi:hypothetical protein